MEFESKPWKVAMAKGPDYACERIAIAQGVEGVRLLMEGQKVTVDQNTVGDVVGVVEGNFVWQWEVGGRVYFSLQKL